ncbi:MAG: OmpA family protein [Deltaproteobacteria bacterium]|nr:OmpA family protein [Deltaproteobacteria bacterium]
MRKPWLVVSVLALGASTALAQTTPSLDKAISVENFQPAAGPQGYITVEGAGVQAHMAFSIGAYFQTSRGGFSVLKVDENNNFESTRSQVIDSSMVTDIVASLGFKQKFQFGLALPVVLALSGDGVNEVGAPGSGVETTGVGDLRLAFKWMAYGTGEGGLAVAAAPVVTVPTSGGKDFVGEDLPTFRPRVLIENKMGKLQLAANLGAIFRAPRTLFSTDISQELTYGAGLGYKVAKPVSVFAEVFGRNGFSADLDSSPMEVDAGLKLRIGNSVQLLAGGGTGLIRGVGTPEWRAFGGLTWAPDRKDTDKDGVYDSDEGKDYLDRSCIDMPEDKDGFEDSDGCPDLDNDNDGIADAIDKCPDQREDKDGFQDEDGCVDPDDDGDGIADIKDACPKAKEDGLAPSKNDGCPNTESDADGDEIVDAKDKCPLEPEDKDCNMDDDGCIDADDDNDGVPDELDACRIAAEDMDGFEDEDGCPELDNDKDGVPDAQDKCADQQETINGVKDDDGCEDTGGKVLTELGEDGQLGIMQPFQWDKVTTLNRKSNAMLDQIGLTMRKQQDVATWRVIIAPEPLKGKSEDEMRAVGQQRAEAIVAALAARGIPASSLEAKGAFASGAQTIIMIAARKQPPSEDKEPETMCTAAPVAATPALVVPTATEPEPEPEMIVDGDGDGVPDADDKCPTEKETLNGYMDQDGCKDKVPAKLKKFSGVVKGVNFKTGSAEIDKKSFKLLDQASKVFAEFQDINIEIGGHTDNQGERDYNITLSLQRAQAVKDYMMGKGIAEGRLTAVGFGPDRPIANNKSGGGRKKNRRTEFKLTQPDIAVEPPAPTP